MSLYYNDCHLFWCSSYKGRSKSFVIRYDTQMTFISKILLVSFLRQHHIELQNVLIAPRVQAGASILQQNGAISSSLLSPFPLLSPSHFSLLYAFPAPFILILSCVLELEVSSSLETMQLPLPVSRGPREHFKNPKYVRDDAPPFIYFCAFWHWKDSYDGNCYMGQKMLSRHWDAPYFVQRKYHLSLNVSVSMQARPVLVYLLHWRWVVFEIVEQQKYLIVIVIIPVNKNSHFYNISRFNLVNFK